VIVDIAHDRFEQGALAFKGSSAESFVGDLAEPTPDDIEPGIGGGDKVQMETGMAFQPRHDARVLVSVLVVHDQMQAQPHRCVRTD
jgi:hypothetical protein